MAADTNTRHRPGALKQQNKSHKTGRHRTKGQLQKEAKGRVSVKVLSRKVKQVNKNDRRNRAQQIRKQKRDEAVNRKRNLGNVPILVAVIPLHADAEPLKVLDEIENCDESATVRTNEQQITHISIPRFKERFAFFIPQKDNLCALLDAAKVAETILFVMSPQGGVDSDGDLLLSCLLAHGISSAVHVVQGLKYIPVKKQNETRKALQKQLETKFPKDKLHPLDSDQEGLLVLRAISNQKRGQLQIQQTRSHMIAENISFELSNSESTVGTLKLTGYLRGQTLSANGLVHLPGWGDFQMLQIDGSTDPYPLTVEKKPRKDSMAMDEEMSEKIEEDMKILDKANPAKQWSLESEVIPDPMEGEQTWPTEEELAEAEAQDKKKKVTKRVPKGTSEYQAAWIVDSGDEEADSEDEDEDEDEEMGEEDEDDSEEEADDASDDDVEYDTVTINDDNDEKYDAAIDMDEEHKMWEKYKAARMDQMFPDEYDTPKDVPSRTRFARYRGLKSFRTSPWDPKENLPHDYARIFQFENFSRSKKKALQTVEEDGGAMPGWYVTVHVANVPRAFMESYVAGTPVVLYGLLPHEQKMSVLNILIKRHRSSRQPIKSKERMVFHMGYRRFSACPVFSQHTNGSKHKFERFLSNDGMSVATVYAPVMFPPAAALMFKEHFNGRMELIGTGSVLSVNPDRIISKRIVLSGHPFKVNKRSAVVRYMFFNRDDIQWFKPVELRTKYGRRGHIKEPLGTHGHMKCVFDGQLKSQDTVLMNLYKRVYPKWTYDPCVNSSTAIQAASESAGMEDEDMTSALFD